MMIRLWIFAILLSTSSLVLAQAPPGKATPKTPTVSVSAYRTQLQSAIDKLKVIEARPPRNIAPILKSLATTQNVRRADGQTQVANGDSWARWGQTARAPKPTQTNVSRAEVQQLRSALETRLESLKAWEQSTYAPADAQAIISQLEGSGQIRTGPTWLQQWTSDIQKWIRTTFTNFMKWIAGLFPTATPGQMPKIDPAWVKAIFFATVLALLALIALLVWRAVGGRIGRRGPRRGVLAEGEDAELLLLPPDELRLRASHFAREGNFREALRHLYVALLLTLDARGVWRYDARRTNWEHITALRSDAGSAALVSPLSRITRVFDRVRYGNAPFNETDWTQFENEVNNVMGGNG